MWNCILNKLKRSKHFRIQSEITERVAVTKGKGQNSSTKRKTGECFQWKANGSCSKGDSCSFLHSHASGNRETSAKEVKKEEYPASNQPWITSEGGKVNSKHPLLYRREKDRLTTNARQVSRPDLRLEQDVKDRRVIFDILPCVIDMLLVRRNPARGPRVRVLEEQFRFWKKKRSKVVYLIITRVPCRRRNEGSIPRAEKFGDLMTADHKVPNEGSESRNNHWYAVVVQDLATQWIQSCPCKNKNSLETEKSLRKFPEPSQRPKVISTDNSFEFFKSCEELSWIHRTSTPCRWETNGIGERAIRRAKEGTSAVLLQSGLDDKWWSDSMECYSYHRREDSIRKTFWRII